jgi:hypothetical protein
MKTINFPYIALVLSSMLFLLIAQGSQVGDDGMTKLPLLTMLVFSEFSFFINAIGAYIGFKHCQATSFKSLYGLAAATCLVFSVGFMLLGISLWPL